MRLLPFVAFFLSGASSLVFQTIWSRLLHHVFGSSSVAISSVVSAFMAGLALGAFIFGRLADRMGKPLLVYAWAEVGVGVAGLLIPWLVDSQGFLATVNGWLRNELGADTSGFMVARFLCILPILIVPTTLMGGTLPLLARHFVPRDAGAQGTSRSIGQLYAVNTVGALFGVFMAGFVLMPGVGITATNHIAAGTNFALAALLFAAGKRWRSAAPLERSRRDATKDATGDAAQDATEDATEDATQDATEKATEDTPPVSAQHAYPLRVRRTAALSFALSGAAALTYEVVWSRALVNTLGASVYAFTLILMTFLGGIAGGSAITSGLLGPPRRAHTTLTLSAVCLLPVATAAIATGAGPQVTLGLSLAGGAGILWTHRQQRLAARRHDALAAAVGDGNAGAAARSVPSTSHALALLAWPLALALAQVLYLRDRLSGMAASVVGLLSLLVIATCRWRQRPVTLLAAIQAFIGLATFTSVLWADELSLAFAGSVAPLYDDLPNHVTTVMGLMCATAGLCVFPSACGMGAMFPLTLQVWSGGGRTVSRDVGVIYTGNTIGSIVGAWLPGFVLMPAIGMQHTLHVGIALNLVLGAAVLASAARRPVSDGVSSPSTPATDRGPTLPVTYAACLLAPLMGVALFVTGAPGSGPLAWDISKMTLGAFRISLARDVMDRESWGGPELVYYRDGMSTTVTVERWGRHLSLKNNGKVDASNGDDMPTQVMVGALPLLLHGKGSEDLEVAVIGFGSGATVGATLQFPVRTVDAVELEAGVVEASRFFADVNHLNYTSTAFPYVDMPRLRVHGDDGRNFLAATDRSFDVIVSEPSNPWLTGVSDLFTREHFEVSKQKLAPGGVYCQWVQLYELSPENVKVIYRTFAHHFAHVVVFSAEDLSSDTILVGSDAPLALDTGHLERALSIPSVRAELERAYVHGPHDVFARILFADRAEVMRYAQIESRRGQDGTLRTVPASNNIGPCEAPECIRQPSLINSDDNAHIEFAAPRDLIGFERYKGYLRSMYARDWPYARFVDRLVVPGGPAAEVRALARQALSLMAHGRTREANRALQLAAERRHQARRPEAAEAARELQRVQGIHARLSAPAPSGPVPTLDAALAHPGLPEGLRYTVRDAQRALSNGRFERAHDALLRVPEGLAEQLGEPLLEPLAYAAHRAGRHGQAIEVIESLLRAHPAIGADRPGLYCVLGRAHDQLDHFDKAVRSMGVCVDGLSRAAERPESRTLHDTSP